MGRGEDLCGEMEARDEGWAGPDGRGHREMPGDCQHPCGDLEPQVARGWGPTWGTRFLKLAMMLVLLNS